MDLSTIRCKILGAVEGVRKACSYYLEVGTWEVIVYPHFTVLNYWLVLPLELQIQWDLDTCISCLLASPEKMEQLTTLSLSRRCHILEKRLTIFCFHIIGVIKRTFRKARLFRYQLYGQTGMQKRAEQQYSSSCLPSNAHTSSHSCS